MTRSWPWPLQCPPPWPLQCKTMPLRLRLERSFEFAALGANWRTEILAGFTTFMTMAYIIFVNPGILHAAGMPLAAVTAATCLSAAIGSFLMGGFAKYPIALAPGMRSEEHTSEL